MGVTALLPREVQKYGHSAVRWRKLKHRKLNNSIQIKLEDTKINLEKSPLDRIVTVPACSLEDPVLV